MEVRGERIQHAREEREREGERAGSASGTR